MSSISLPTYRDFLRVMASGLRDDERLVVDVVNGDPGNNENMRNARRKYLLPRQDWTAFELPSDRNLYVCVMSVPAGVHNRLGASFSGGVALMIDDVGDLSKERGIKVPKDLLAALKPSALVETSPGNYQAWYRLTKPARDPDLFNRIIKAFIREKLLGNDPGMGSVARIARIPYGINMKPSRNGWKVRLAELNEDVSYAPADLIDAFGLVLDPPRPAVTEPPDAGQKAIEDFKYRFLKEFLESKDSRNADLEHRRGEWKVVCPRAGSHSGGVNSGTTILHPAMRRNGEYSTQFWCSHGQCGINSTADAIKAICDDSPEAKSAWLKFWIQREVSYAELQEANASDIPFEIIQAEAAKEEAARTKRANAFLSSMKGERA